MLTREEYLVKIGASEDELKRRGLEVVFIGEVGYPEGEDDGWDTHYISPKQYCCGTIHHKL